MEIGLLESGTIVGKVAVYVLELPAFTTCSFVQLKLIVWPWS